MRDNFSDRCTQYGWTEDSVILKHIRDHYMHARFRQLSTINSCELYLQDTDIVSYKHTTQASCYSKVMAPGRVRFTNLR